MDSLHFADVYQDKIKPVILKRLSTKLTDGENKVPLFGLESEHRQISKVLEDTVKHHEGKSVLLIGPRGVGKTSLVNNCLLEIQKKYHGRFLLIKLSGLFAKDDKTAIREIARQLDWIMSGHSNQISSSKDEDWENTSTGFEKVSSNATMNMLIGMLDKARLDDDDDDDDDENEDDNEEYVSLSKVKDRQPGTVSAQIPLIFIIDEIEKYASNSKQTLLYNIFDMAQSSSTPISKGSKVSSTTSSAVTVIGITARATVREQLEKRVKSRFSQRIIQINKCRNLDDFCDSVCKMLTLEEVGDDKEYIKYYNDKIKQMVAKRGTVLRKTIVENFYTIKSLATLKNSLVPFIKYSNVIDEHESNEWFTKGSFDDRNFHILGSLSELELKLLICSARVKVKHSTDKVNFSVAFEEYLKMASKESKTLNTQLETMGISFRHNTQFQSDRKNSYTRSRDVMLGCWEMLAQIGLIGEPMKQINGVNASAYTGGEFNRIYVCDLELNEIMKYFKGEKADRDESYSWVERWCRI